MYDAFKKWSLLGHTFTFVKLTPAEVESLGAATRQFLEPDEDGDSNAAATVREARRISRSTFRKSGNVILGHNAWHRWQEYVAVRVCLPRYLEFFGIWFNVRCLVYRQMTHDRELIALSISQVLPSLKYHFPPPPARRGLRTRPMTVDQKAMNAIFLRYTSLLFRMYSRVVAKSLLRLSMGLFSFKVTLRLSAVRAITRGLLRATCGHHISLHPSDILCTR